MDVPDHGHDRPSRPSGDVPVPLVVRMDEEVPYLSAVTEHPSDGLETAGTLAQIGDRASCGYFLALRTPPASQNLPSETVPTSNTINPPSDHLELRLQALERTVQFLIPALGKDGHALHELATQQFPNSAQGIEALGNNELTVAIDGFGSRLPFSQPDLQIGATERLRYGASIIAPLQYNDVVDAGGSGVSSVPADNLDNDFSNIDVNATRLLDDLSVLPQNGTASQMISNSRYNEHYDGDYNDLFDFSAASMPSDTGMVGCNMSGENHGDDHGSAMAATPINAVPTSSATPGAHTSRPRVHRCVNCHKTFARRADRDRHTLTHDRDNIRTYSCAAPGCDRVGTNGFWRVDKFREHRVKMGH